MIWYFTKTMRKALFGLYVHEPSLNRMKELVTKNPATRVVLVPIFKSFADYFIQVFINFSYNIDLPFTFGNMEDTPHIKLFDEWVGQTGYIFAKRSNGQNLQSHYINSTLLKEIIENNKITTVF